LFAFQVWKVLSVRRAELVRPDVARGIAAGCRVLDLDHLGPELGESNCEP
jgi:hypothetical protein